jgi:GT2 family glycosyltransferase
MIDLSISIVAYNDESDVRKAVESIERCTPLLLCKKIYIVDNSDIDNDLKSLSESFDDVCYIKTGANLGFGKGHNQVLSMLDSKYTAIVNPDVILINDAFTPLIKFMDETGAGMCVPRITDHDGNLLKVYRRELTPFDMFIRMFFKIGFKKRRAYHTMQEMDYDKPFRVPFAQGSFLLIKTDLYKKLGGFDERFFLYMEDADLCKRVNAESELLYCPYASVIHKWNMGSHKSLKLFDCHVRSCFKYFKKWRS